MPPEQDETQAVDRGDDYTPPETAGKVEEAPVETKPDEDSGDLDVSAADETETEVAAKEATDEEEKPVRDEKGRFIPKERFDEAVQRERDEKDRIAARLAELEKREADRAVSEDMQQASEKLATLSKEHTQLISDGELDKAAEKMTEMLQLQSDMQERRAQALAKESGAQTKNEMQYDAMVARLELEYPEINPDDAEHFDRDAVRRVQAYMTGLIQMENMSPGKALQESVTTILGAKRAEEDKTDEAKAKEAEDLGMRRKEAAVSKAVDAQAKQPASLKDVGQDHDKEGGSLDAAAVMKMSWEEFVKLPEDKLSEMRGDHVG